MSFVMIPSERKEAFNFYHLVGFLLRNTVNKLPRKLGLALDLNICQVVLTECDYRDNTRLQIVALLNLWEKQYKKESIYFKKWKIHAALKTFDIDKEILFEVSRA